MGNSMNKILNGLYLGNFRDAKDPAQLTQNCITHIVSVHDNAKPLQPDKVYLCLTASDSPGQDLSQYFSQCNDFIHRARLNGGGVLVHCLAGVSRSSTIVVAYVMSVTGLDYRSSLDAVRAARGCASPNFGFQRQLLAFQYEGAEKEQQRLLEKFGPSPFSDKADCLVLLEQFRDSEARRMQDRGALYYTPGLSRYPDEGESTRTDSSADAASAKEKDEHALNYARKAIKEVMAMEKLRLEEWKSNKATEDGVVQDSDVSSSTAETHSASETDHQPDDADSAAENGQSPSSSPSGNDQVSSSNVDGPAAANDHAAVEAAAEKCVSSMNEMDGLAVCLT